MPDNSFIAPAVVFALALATGAPASASLIGDMVSFQCTNCFPPSHDTFVVRAGESEMHRDGAEIDVEATTLRITFFFDTEFLIPDVNIVWSDLDWLGDSRRLAGVSIDPSSTWGLTPAASIALGSDFVSVTNNGDSSVRSGDSLVLNLDFQRVAEPGSLALFGSSLTALLLAGPRVTRRR